MFRSFFKMAWRNLIKDRQFTILNVFGLSAGITCALLIWLWVQDEMSFDKSFDKSSQIYQLMEQRKANGSLQLSDESSGLLSETLKAKFSEIEYATPVVPSDWFQPFTLSSGEKNIKATGEYAGKDYFHIFSFELLEGQRSTILYDKNSIALSDELAVKLFGTTENILGKLVRFQHEKDFFVSGVFKKPSYHSSQQFDFVLPFEYYAESQTWVKSWSNTGPHNFVLLKPATNIANFNKKIASTVSDNSSDSTRSVYASAFSDSYLLHTFLHGAQVGSRIGYVKTFSLIAMFILLIACINFMNLSTAKAHSRMKEVGIKKVIGARRKHLIWQFFSESILVTLVATAIAVAVASALLPQFNSLTGKEIALHFNLSFFLSLTTIIVFTGLLSGSYPALYLSGFKPLAVLKGKLPDSASELLSRKGLVVFQFTLSAVLIVTVLVVYNQVKYIQATDPGYTKDNIVRFDSEGAIQGNEETFIDGLKKLPGVVDASFTFNNMVGRNFGTYNWEWAGKAAGERTYIEGFGIGYHFLNTMGMRMTAGRDFSREFGESEGLKVILNEAAVQAMQLKEPIGSTVKLFGRDRQVIGVVKNFHFESLHETVGPAYLSLIRSEKNPWLKIMVRIKPGDQQQTIAGIKRYYDSYNPGFPFSFHFLDDAYRKQYDSETKVAALSKYFSGLAILISCLGLFGLAAFTAQKRQKEIGIRKVVGASARQIVMILSADFLKLIAIAVLIAFPTAWWAMNAWLQGFAYRVNIGPEIFLTAGISVILITALTISFQAIKAAVANPVKSLRSE